MWFRIELNKDSSVASCVRVSGSRIEGKSVHYVEADTEASAIAILLARYATNNEARRRAALERANNLRSKGLCRRCGEKPCSAGLTSCRDCLNKRNARYAERSSGAPALDMKPKTAEEKAAAQLRRQAHDVRKASKKAAGHLIMVRVAYARCLQAFDDMRPSNYRTWLVEALRQAQEKERLSAIKRSGSLK